MKSISNSAKLIDTLEELRHVRSARYAAPVRLPPSHPSQKLFKPYSKVSSLIKNLSNRYDLNMSHSFKYDSALSLRNKFVRDQPKANPLIRPSVYPKLPLSKELFDKFTLIDAYQNLSEKKTSTKKLESASLSPLRISRREIVNTELKPKAQKYSQFFLSQPAEIEDVSETIKLVSSSTQTVDKTLPSLPIFKKKFHKKFERFNLLKQSPSRNARHN